MKIDNKLFMFIFQKKKKGAAIFPILLCVILLCGFFGSGVLVGKQLYGEQDKVISANAESVQTDTEGKESKENVSEEEFVDGNYILSSTLASMTIDKYQDATSPYGYTYGDAITGLTRTDHIVLQAGFAVEDMDVEYWTEIVNLYADPELKDPIGPCFAYDEGSREITISPSNYPFGKIYVSGINRDIVGRYTHDNIFFFPQDSGSAWGNLSTMYLASYVDLQTGEKLDVPQVQIVTMNGELPVTPRMTYSFTDDGRVTFNWSRVEGAAEYFVCRYEYSEEYGNEGGISYIASTTETTWTSEAPEYGAVMANIDFKNYDVAEDDWFSSYNKDEVIAEYGESPIFIYDTADRYFYCVIAISEIGTSMMSNSVDILSLQDSIPVSVAYDTWVENGYSYSGYESTDELCAYGYVTMANGMTAMKLINYDTDKAIAVEDRYIYTDEDGNYLEGENVNILKIPYRIEGTPFEDIISVFNYDNNYLQKDLASIEEREDMLRKRAGEMTLDNDISFEEEETAAEQVREVSFEITANSALSEYLASNMLAGVSIIDVSDFSEASDTSILGDAVLEAYYQNPYIFGITGYQINQAGTAVKIEYEEAADINAKKQQEVQEKATAIISEIITPDMTELEKELAINQYLCATCTYSDAALVNAEENNFEYIDDIYIDAFTAYGALINGDCVCAGYAAAFKILADLADLDCVVVTGMLDGNLPHAWNKIRIDGEWEILDVTNNDNEFLSNALFNLPDEAGSRTLTECNDYVMDGYMRNYTATNGQREYYRLNELYFDYDEIGERLAEQLSLNGVALLRTEYSLDDSTFNRIAEDVYQIIGLDKDLYGYYWMGVIYLTTNPS
ncbi:MAG TPA: transglutaminase domain-containing protein [Lachnospiraceae bacterium]|nr:transglutaminase domain-containing protein [Lachnospiraceae bacterium]